MDSWGRCGQNDGNRRATEREGGGWRLECYMSLWHIIGKHRIYLPLTVLCRFPRQAVITPLTHTSDAKYTHLHLQEMCSNELPVRKRECAVAVAAGVVSPHWNPELQDAYVPNARRFQWAARHCFLKMWGQVVLFNPRWRERTGSVDCRRGLMF